MRILSALISAIIAAYAGLAEARPEYANRTKIRCSGCHVSPAGAGPRNIAGKAFGSNPFASAKTSLSDWYYADIRSVYFLPERPSETSNGFALMKASASANIPIQENDQAASLRLVMSYDFSQLIINPTRDIYAMWSWDNEDSWAPEHVLVGRFHLPFGLLTDEHRTYTKLQVNTSLQDFEMGTMLSGNPNECLHYDFSLTNGVRSRGGQFTEVGDQTFGVTVNFRWTPKTQPFFLGLSAMHEATQINRPSPTAGSLYSSIALDKLFESFPKLDLNVEVVLAEHWNRNAFNTAVGKYFVGTNTAFGAGIENSASLGAMTELKWQASDEWTLSYKYDEIALDRSYLEDRFVRHGLGARFHFDANASVLIKAEVADVGRSDLEETGLVGAQNNLIAVLRLWL